MQRTPQTRSHPASTRSLRRQRLRGRRGRPSTAFWLFLLLAAGLLATAEGAGAQGGVVVVRVTGADGPVGGAAVELVREETVVAATAADRDGVARLIAVPAGRYTVRVDALGYRSGRVESAEVVVGGVRVVEVWLERAPVELEGIEVRSDRIQIQRENTDFATTVDEETIALLPVGYAPTQLVALTPGARAEQVWGGASFQANSYQIDGVSANHPGLGGSIIEPSRGWVERVEVRGLGAGAEHGGFQGGQVNVVTKRGRDESRAMLRTTLEDDALAASNLVLSEIGSEVTDRYDVEGEASGAVVRDRLYYYVGGTYSDRSARFLNHMTTADRYAPVLEERRVRKTFGKLTWTPRPADEVNLSGAYLGTDVDNYGMTGYEAPGAAARYSSPTWFANLSWRHALGDRATLEARLNHFARDERSVPYGGREEPAVRLFSLTPPYTTFGNAPFTLRSAPSSTSARVVATVRLPVGGQENLVKVGAEYTRGRFLDRRTRSGGMTWMPVLSDGFDPDDPGSWAHPTEGFLPTRWGGEVHLDADVTNVAGFVQTSVSLGRLVVSPGLRWSAWRGWLDPRAGARFRAVADQGLDPRIGATLDLLGDGSLVAKGHWGRYHQDLIAQMFDRAGGSDAFTNQEIWYYHGPAPADPERPFTAAERDALAEQGLFTRESVVSLNETGPVVDYDQPYVDQWLVGLERQFGEWVKVEALYTRRTNRDMIALVDRNRAFNYTRFERVRVHMGGPGGTELPFQGGSVLFPELYVPNHAVLAELRRCAANPGLCDGPPAGLSFADTSSLTWDPDYVLTNAPDGRRHFRQLQVTVKVERPRWGGSFSVALTSLEGNLDNVAGYADPSQYSPGPYVRVNEGINAYGTLSNFSEREAKVSVWGLLPWELRGGAFWTFRSGDHYAPRFRITGQPNLYGYVANAETQVQPCPPVESPCPPLRGDPLPLRFLQPLEGHEIFVGPRGAPQMSRRALLDLRLERRFGLDGLDLGLALDVFNVLGRDDVTEVQTMVNHGQNYRYYFDDLSTPFRRTWAGKWYESPLDRVPPRRVRLGAALYF